MAGISFSGLSSGLDTESMITSLMAIERLPRNRLTLNQTAATTRQQALQDVLSRMKTLRTASQDLGSTLLWSESQTVASTDENKLKATMTGGAAPGGYSVAVTQMATAAQSTFAFTSQSSATTIEINGVTVALAADAKIGDAVSSINSSSALGVFAVDVGNGKLVLTSRQTGSAQTITATSDALSPETTKAGRDLKYSINGEAQPDSQSNTVANAIPGVTLTVKSPTTDTTINVSTPGVASDAIKTKLKAFVSAYNDLVEFTNGKLTEKKVVINSESDDGATLTSSDAAKGVLFGDSGLRNMLSTLRQGVSSSVSGLTGLKDFAALGITTGQSNAAGTTSDDAKKGKLTFDEKTFDAAYEANPLAIKKLLGGVGGTDGLAQKWEGVLKPLTQANGVLDQRVTMAGNEVTRVKDSIGRMDERLERKEETMRKMFTAMELALQRSKSQTSDLLGSLGSSSS